MQVLTTKGEVIRWAGGLRAYPILRGDKPDLSRPGDDESGVKRVGWREFFQPLRRLGLASNTRLACCARISAGSVSV